MKLLTTARAGRCGEYSAYAFSRPYSAHRQWADFTRFEKMLGAKRGKCRSASLSGCRAAQLAHTSAPK